MDAIKSFNFLSVDRKALKLRGLVREDAAILRDRGQAHGFGAR